MTLYPRPLFAALLLVCGSAACSPIGSEATAEDPARSQLLETIEEQAKGVGTGNCLLLVWSEEDDPDVEFDRAHDTVKGGAISCTTGTSPSRFEAAIGSLREAAKSGDKARILEQLGVPLLYIDENGERQDLDEGQVEALFDTIFDDRMLDILQRLDLSQMTVEKDQGAFFELGTLWLVVDDSGQPRVVTVNRQALLEAAAAAREQSDLGQGRAID